MDAFLHKISPLAALLVFLVAPVANSQPVGALYQNSITIAKANSNQIAKRIPLPPGIWRVLSSLEVERNSTSGSNPKFLRLYLGQDDGKMHTWGLEIYIYIGDSMMRWSDEPCKSTNHNYRNTFGSTGWEERCLIVQPVSFIQSGNQSSLQIANSLRNFQVDRSAVRVSYVQIDDRDTYVKYSLYFFPSNYGLDNPSVSSPSESPFHPNNLKSNPQNVRFIDALIAYGERIAPALRMALSSGHLCTLPGFQFNQPGKNQSRSEEARPVDRQNESKVAERLRTLKELLDSKLITQQEYEAKRREVLQSL